MKFFLKGLIILNLFACSSIKSGRYVKVSGKKDLEDISKFYGVSIAKIKQYNPSLKTPGLVYIPIDIGLMKRKKVYEKMPTSMDGFLWPIASYRKISSFFGQRGRRHHDGIDISAPKGTKILAAADGLVLHSGWMRGYGKVIIIKHAENYHTVYAHASKNIAQKGKLVKKGDCLLYTSPSPRD